MGLVTVGPCQPGIRLTAISHRRVTLWRGGTRCYMGAAPGAEHWPKEGGPSSKEPKLDSLRQQVWILANISTVFKYYVTAKAKSRLPEGMNPQVGN